MLKISKKFLMNLISIKMEGFHERKTNLAMISSKFLCSTGLKLDFLWVSHFDFNDAQISWALESINLKTILGFSQKRFRSGMNLTSMWEKVCCPIKVKEIILCYRRFGQNPTEEIITKRMALINPTASKLTFPEFCEMMGNTINYYDLEFSLGPGIICSHTG